MVDKTTGAPVAGVEFNLVLVEEYYVTIAKSTTDSDVRITFECEPAKEYMISKSGEPFFYYKSNSFVVKRPMPVQEFTVSIR